MMKALILLTILTMITPTIQAKVYKAPKFKLKEIPQYQIKNVKEYQQFRELEYKVNTRPVRQRKIASKKRGGRIPSSQTQNYHKYHVEKWVWKK